MMISRIIFTKKRSKALILICLVLPLSCTNYSPKSIDNDLMDAVLEVIDSNVFHEKIISVIKSDYDYNDYDLYKIMGFRYSHSSDDHPFEIIKLRDKVVLFYRFDIEKVYHKDFDKMIDENYDCGYWGNPCSDIAYFFAKCKDSNKKLLYRAVNNDIRSFEIPIVRNFTCSFTVNQIKGIEIITENHVFFALDDYVLEKDTIEKFPYKLILTLNIYNRTDSCLLLDGTNTSLGQFKLVNGMDSLSFTVNEMLTHDLPEDDSKYQVDSQRHARLKVTSEENLSFFERIDPVNYHDNLNSLIRDSLIYLPNKDFYNSYSGNCMIPKENIRIITPSEGYYTYFTPNYTYVYSGGKLSLKDEK